MIKQTKKTPLYINPFVKGLIYAFSVMSDKKDIILDSTITAGVIGILTPRIDYHAQKHGIERKFNIELNSERGESPAFEAALDTMQKIGYIDRPVKELIIPRVNPIYAEALLHYVPGRPERYMSLARHILAWHEFAENIKEYKKNYIV